MSDEDTSDQRQEPQKLRRPCTIGEISGIIGCDVRELYISGWTDEEIQNLIDKKLAEMQAQLDKESNIP